MQSANKSAGAAKSFEQVLSRSGVLARRSEVLACRKCPRLVSWIDTQRRVEPSHHNAPVVDRGPRNARLLLVGLAPGRLGANRTGRVFVGDASSNFLFDALHAVGFASSPEPESALLAGARLTNVVKCLPPQNRPLRQELHNCSHHLRAELAQFWAPRSRKPRVLLSLGGVAHRALWQALPETMTDARPCPPFRHGQQTNVAANLLLISCFHPSKLNTQTGRLTKSMLQTVLWQARESLGND